MRAKPDPKAAAVVKGKSAINEAIALFNRRWTMRVLWELRHDALNFRALQEACADVSSSVLTVRLAELRDAGLVAHSSGSGYELTPSGHELLVAIKPLTLWAVKWQDNLTAKPR